MAQNFRDWMGKQKGYSLGSKGATPLVNNVAINPQAAGMKNIGGSWTGTENQYKNSISGLAPLTKLRDYFSTDEIGHVGATPSINGYQVDPNKFGMNNIEGYWHGTQDQLSALKNSLPQQEQNTNTFNKTVEDNPFKSEYSDQIKSLALSVAQPQQFSYDATKDSAYNAASNATMAAVQRAAGKTNMLYGGDTAKRMTDESTQLYGDYENKAYEKYMNEQNQNINRLSALSGLQAQERGMYDQDISNTFAESSVTGKYQGGNTLAGQEMNLAKEAQAWQKQVDNRTYNYNVLRDNVTDQQWGKQYQMSLDEFEWNRNPNNPQVRGQILNNMILGVELDYLPRQKQLEFAKLSQDLDTGKISQDAAKAQIQQIYTDIESSRVGMDLTRANTGLTKANIDQTKANTEQTKLTTEAAKNTNTDAYTKEDYTLYKNRLNNVIGKNAPLSGEAGKANRKKIANDLSKLVEGGLNNQLYYDLVQEFGLTEKDFK